MSDLYSFSPTAADGRAAPLERYRGQVVLIVNVASRCGFTPQYAGLEALQRRYGAQGLQVLGFPCNQFGAQEPGNAEEIAGFCSTTYDVSFPVLAKIEVNGPRAEPLYDWLKREKGGLLGSAIKWNFTKFLLDRRGHVAARYAPTVKPDALAPDIERLLAAA